MALDPISDNDPAGWHSKINQALSYWNGGAPPTSFGGARSALNAVADDLALPRVLPSDTTAAKRGKINAIIGGLGIPDGADLYFDFLNDRYFGGTPNLVRSTPALMLGHNGYQSFAAGELARIDGVGAQVAPQAVNKVTARKAKPVDLTNVLSTGGAVVTVVAVADLPEPVKAAFLTSPIKDIVTSVYRVVCPSVPSGVQFLGSAVNLTAHTASIFAHVVSGDASRILVNGLPVTSVGTNFTRTVVTGTVNEASVVLYLRQYEGTAPGEYYVAFPQLEERSFATPPVASYNPDGTEQASAATRGGDLLTADLTGRLGYGVAGFVKVDLKALEADRFLLHFGETTANRLGLLRTAGGNVRMFQTAASAMQGDVVGGVLAAGVNTIAFAAGVGFMCVRVVGGPASALAAPSAVASMSQLGIGGRGYDATANSYQITEKLTLFDVTPARPVNQALFDEVYTNAVAA